MVTLPPPTLPTTLPTQAIPPASIPVALDVVSVANTVAALQQRVVVQVLSIDIDLSRYLLNVLTPQGNVSLALPPAGPGSSITLPNGQTVPLQSVLTNATAAEVKSGLLLQLDSRASAADTQLPTARLLLAPDILTAQATATNINLSTPQPATQNPNVPLRTQAFALPAGSFDFPNVLQAPKGPAASVPLLARLATAIQNQLSSALNPTAQNKNIPAQATPNTVASSAPTAPIANRTVEVFSAPQADAAEVTIVGNTPRGDVVVRTAAGETVSLPHIRSAVGAANVGEKLYIRPTADSQPPPADKHALPTLQAVLDELQTSNPAMAMRVAAQTLLPLHTHSAAQVGGTMLFFLSALTGGTFASPQVNLAPALQRLLGKAVQDKLVDELSSLTRTLPDSRGVEWRGYQLPTPPLDGLQAPVWLYVQQRPDDSANGGQDSDAPQTIRQTRFLVDLHLTRMGHTQLEGIAKQNQIDLKLNTPAPLPREMQNELTGIFTGAAGAYGFAGELMFTSGTLIDIRARNHAERLA